MSKFTKGPWKFSACDGSITDFTKAENEIAIVSTEGWDELGMGFSNANLIACAPEMYEMLERVIECGNNAGGEIYHSDLISNLHGDINKLLKRARGE